MLRMETPMNKPSNPPQLEMKSVIVDVSVRLRATTWGSLKKILTFDGEMLKNDKNIQAIKI